VHNHPQYADLILCICPISEFDNLNVFALIYSSSGVEGERCALDICVMHGVGDEDRKGMGNYFLPLELNTSRE
jgi:hypothetical protein